VTQAARRRSSLHADPGSFRDRDSKVLYDDREVLRGLSERGLADWRALESSALYSRFSESGQLVGSELIDTDSSDRNGWAALLRHERIPFVSYPYEWTFSMLKDAALLQLDLTLAGLDEQLMLKDGSPYNVQWRGTRPVFIDVGSFERLRPGEPWVAYRQFCMLFLFPLLLEAYRGLSFQTLLRGSLEGIEPDACRRMLRLRDLIRPGVLNNVVLHSRLQRANGDGGGGLRRELEAAGFSTQMIRTNVTRLRKLVSGLQPASTDSSWSEYGHTNTYSSDEIELKAEVVRQVACALQPELVWDIGCNDGRFSRIAAQHAKYTLALDADRATVEHLYRSLVADDIDSILPLVLDVADPSPALGWRNLERKTLPERGQPDLILCLALVHHLSITRNVPLGGFVEWLRSLDSAALIEFPDPHDPMVRRLLEAKRVGTHDDYTRGNFEQLLAEQFTVETSTAVSSTRTIYFARPRQ
jgi:SAM-dependent methyltransferase